jgi:hypothetical protein
MYKDKEVNNVNNVFVNVWRKNIFDIYVTEYGTALDNYFTYFVPVFKYTLNVQSLYSLPYEEEEEDIYPLGAHEEHEYSHI